MGTWLKNIWTDPKSSLTGLIALSVIVAQLAVQYPTVKWLAVGSAVLGGLVKLVTKD